MCGSEGKVQQAIEQLRTEALGAFDVVTTTAELEAAKVKYLGRKGPVQELMQQLRTVDGDQRPVMGKLINDLKNELAARIDELLMTLTQSEEEAAIAEEKIDVTLPGRRRFCGGKHILTQVLDDIVDILVGMGFSVQYGPHIESDYYNFEALNMDKDHPARDMQDTFYITPEVLLRTHTSNIQARVMEKTQPPIRIIAPGRSFRNEDISARSHVQFHQVEGLYIDRGVTFADLMATMDEFWRKLFNRDVAIRYRPSFFPFVEPGLEVDVECLNCKGNGCVVCKKTGWLEVAGAGMVHPEVLKNGGIDPEEFSGFAWGMGLDRLVLIKHGIPDIRLFWENDLRFLRQFPGV